MAPSLIDELLESVRSHLGMDTAMLMRFDHGTISVVASRGDSAGCGATIGEQRQLAGSLLESVLDGHLPLIVPNTRVLDLPAGCVDKRAVRSWAFVPIRRPDGSPSGMLCSLARTPKQGLGLRQANYMAAVAGLIAFEEHGEFGCAQCELSRPDSPLPAGAVPAPVAVTLVDGTADQTVDVREASIPGLSELTARQRQIVALLDAGYRVPLIAQRVFLSQGTVRNELSAIYRKLGVHSQQQLVELLKGGAHDAAPAIR